jgi:HlyD family secretion protein
MRQDLFRRTALEALEAPEFSGQMLRVTSPRDWAVFAGVLLLMGSAGAWGWFGSITRTAEGRALLVRSGGVVSVDAPGPGQVVEFNVKAGDPIRIHQIIARLSNPVLTEQVRLAEEALAEARREAARTVKLRTDTARLKAAAIDRERSNLEREIATLQDQERFAAERVAQQEQLFVEKLTTKQSLVDAQEKTTGIHNDIARHYAQIEQLQADQFAIEAAPQDTGAEVTERVSDLARHLAGLRQELRQTTTITSPCEGEALEVKTYLGAVTAAGSPLITIQPKERTLEALAYVPSSQAKMVRIGMEAQLSPSTVRREEHGYLRATVTAVSDFPLSPTALLRRFENESIATAMAADGPVTEIRLALYPDKIQASGYRWSSAKGPPVTLSSGTLCDVMIVTQRQRPLSLIIPSWKERLGIQ